MIRVVVDPGVFISALIGARGSAPDVIVRAFIDERIAVITSPQLLGELERVVLRPKFARYADERTRREFVERVRRHSIAAEDPTDPPAVTRDRDDDYLVALALAAEADALVSGDRDLLDVGLDTPAVWPPRELADRIAAG